MKPSVRTVTLMIAAATLCGRGVAAQQQPSPPSAARTVGSLVPVKVVIVMSRHQGDTLLSSLPYTLAVNADGNAFGAVGQFMSTAAQLRTGASVPVPPLGGAKDSLPPAVGPVQYKSIGTSIDCSARSTDDGRFRLDISVEDTSVYAEGQSAQGVPTMSDVPSFRTFKSSNAVMLKDGQSTEFTAAADRITGEVTRIAVSITVVK